MKLSERLDIAAKIHEDMSGKTALSTTIREAAELVRSVEGAAPHLQVEAGGCAPPVILPLPPWCQQPAEAVAAIPSASTIASAIWRDWMTNEQADKLGADLHRWLLAHVTAPPPAIDIGKLREGIGSVRNHFEYMKRRYAISTQARVACDDGIAEINELAALIGDGGEVGDRDAYEGAREDLLDWKGRALRAEAELRRLGYAGIVPDQQPAEAVAWMVRSDKLADFVTIYRGEAQTMARVRDGGVVVPLYTAPPPAIDIGKLRGAVETLNHAIATQLGSRVTIHATRARQIRDELAALIGDGGEVGRPDA